MVQTCSKCSRANPAEAVYCYFDGFVLGGHARNGAPLAAGSRPFPAPFVFPDGRACRSFDELALGCHEEWAAARQLLAAGFFANFLGNLGRLDLAAAAREAAKFPDRDRGLDQLLAGLPSGVLDPPKLRAEPAEINLGVLRPGDTREFPLRLENRGMRLLYGSVSCADGNWLALGDPPGSSQKLFQFTHEAAVVVRVRGDRLRASRRPLEARLLVESNGGTANVVVRAEVPVRPFPIGVLAGSTSPRQVAEKAKAHLKEASVLFEQGAVAEWYRANGWEYPVTIPAASGAAAVQQFYEAHGFARAPKVDISARAVNLAGEPGQSLRHTLEVRSEERKPVYAHAVSSAAWLEVGRARLNGRTASIDLAVPSVPDRPGEVLTAQVTVLSNGNQRFVVPVTLGVSASAFDFSRPAADPAPVEAVPVAAVPAAAAAAAPEAVPLAAVAAEPDAAGRAPARGRDRIVWKHALPAAALLAVLAGLVTYDALSRPPKSGGGPAPKEQIGVGFGELSDPEPRLEFVPNPNQNLRFGLVLPREKDPKEPDRPRRLTYDEAGRSNNTCVKIDGSEYLFGMRPGRLVVQKWDRERHAWLAEWAYEEGIRVTQVVQIVPGQQTGVLDTCLVRYEVRNDSREPHKVGLRAMLDTFIGAQDGVPFAIPGQRRLLTRPQELREKEIPDFIQALERPDLNNPGTVAHFGLKGLRLPGVTLEPIVRVLVCQYPSNPNQKWEFSLKELGRDDMTIDDSCLVIYWAEAPMNPGEVRDMAYSYGLNAISGAEGGEGPLALTAGGSFHTGDEFTVTAYVKKPQPGQKAALQLPDGLELADKEEAEKAIDEATEYTPVSWRVRSLRDGEYDIKAASGMARATYRVRVTTRGLFR
jgi:hypothetical protein